MITRPAKNSDITPANNENIDRFNRWTVCHLLAIVRSPTGYKISPLVEKKFVVEYVINSGRDHRTYKWTYHRCASLIGNQWVYELNINPSSIHFVRIPIVFISHIAAVLFHAWLQILIFSYNIKKERKKYEFTNNSSKNKLTLIYFRLWKCHLRNPELMICHRSYVSYVFY